MYDKQRKKRLCYIYTIPSRSNIILFRLCFILHFLFFCMIHLSVYELCPPLDHQHRGISTRDRACVNKKEEKLRE